MPAAWNANRPCCNWRARYEQHLCDIRRAGCTIDRLEAGLCAAGRDLGRILFVHAHGRCGVGRHPHSRAARGDCLAVPVPTAAGARAGDAAPPKLEAGAGDWHAELGRALCVLQLRAAVHLHRAVIHPQRHDAAVWRADRVAVAQRQAQWLAHSGTGDRLCRRSAAGLGQGQLQARCIRRVQRLGGAGLPAGDAVLWALGQFHQALHGRAALAGVGHRQPVGRDYWADAADLVVLAPASRIPERLAGRHRAGRAVLRRGLHPLLPPD